ncbi:MAG: NAD(P)-binding protein, partial [Balneolaceae bacterium]
MRIGVIGAGLAGLAAGRTLTKAGHEVCIFEEHGCTGGRLATWMAPSEPVVPVDYGYPFLSGSSPEFSRFLAELLEKNLLTVWGNNVAHFDGEQVHSESPNRKPDLRYAAPGGFSKISQYMERWVDIRYGEHAIGLTYIGSGRRKKRPW